MDLQNIVAIDVHTHAEISERIPDDPLRQAIQEASSQYFKHEGLRPTIAARSYFPRGLPLG